MPKGKPKSELQNWWIYILRCNDNTLYTGITTDIKRRLQEHNGRSKLGARYTRGRQPVTLVYSEAATSRSSASQREYAIKNLSRPEKQALFAKSKLKKHSL